MGNLLPIEKWQREFGKKMSLNLRKAWEKKNIYHCFLWYATLENKTPQNHFQNFRQSCVLLLDRIEFTNHSPIAWRREGKKGHTSGCNWSISIPSVNNTQDWRKFWKRFRRCFVFQSRVSTKTMAKRSVNGNRNGFQIENFRLCGKGKQIMVWALSTMVKGCTCTFLAVNNN